MNKRKFTLLLIFLLSLVSVFIIVIHRESKPKPIHHIHTKEFSHEEYKKIEDELMTLVSQQNPRVALSKIREEIKTNETLAGACHGLVHEIGHAAYEKYHDFGLAMQYKDEICNSGYIHGIIESSFATATDILSSMQAICSDYSPQSFIGWECYHGVGHGLMYFTENMLPKSLALCETYKNNDAKAACVNGVFMENFNVDQKLHVSKYIKADDPFYPCTDQKLAYKTDCYIYAPTYYLSLHKNDYLGALTLCKKAENDFQATCVSGVGSQAIKENINNPKFVESVCSQGNTNENTACISGMVGLYINHFGGLNEAKVLCQKLTKTNKQICEQIIASKHAFFN